MLELIVCGNIVGLDIPIRVVQHELWRPHILETTADDYSSDCEAEVCVLYTYAHSIRLLWLLVVYDDVMLFVRVLGAEFVVDDSIFAAMYRCFSLPLLLCLLSLLAVALC